MIELRKQQCCSCVSIGSAIQADSCASSICAVRERGWSYRQFLVLMILVHDCDDTRWRGARRLTYFYDSFGRSCTAASKNRKYPLSQLQKRVEDADYNNDMLYRVRKPGARTDVRGYTLRWRRKMLVVIFQVRWNCLPRCRYSLVWGVKRKII